MSKDNDDGDDNNIITGAKPASSAKGYESLSRSTIQGIQQSDSLAIWSLLRSMPNEWVVRKKWIKNELMLGETRYSKAVKRLRDLGLWKTVRQRNKQGKILGSSIHVFDTIETSTDPYSGKPDSMGSLKVRKKRGTYEINTTKDLINKKEKIKTRHAEGGNPLGSFKKSPLTFSEDFGVCLSASLTTIIDENRAVAICKKLNLDAEDVRKVLAEFSAMVVRGQVNDTYATFYWLCKAQVNQRLETSKLGEDNKPEWS